MSKKITKTAITALALIILATSAGVASAANGAAGGGKGGNGGGARGNGSSAGGVGAESGSGLPTHLLRKTEQRETKTKPKRKITRLFTGNCSWVRKTKSDGSTYAFRYALECQKSN